MSELFELTTDLSLVVRRDFPLDAAIASTINPNDSEALLMGEWVEMNDTYQMRRGSSVGRSTVYPVFSEKGRYDVQMAKLVPVLFHGNFEADTMICDVTSVGVGDLLKVGDVTIGGKTKRGLLRATGGVGASTEVIVGKCTRLFSGEAKLRFQSLEPRKLA